MMEGFTPNTSAYWRQPVLQSLFFCVLKSIFGAFDEDLLEWILEEGEANGLESMWL